MWGMGGKRKVPGCCFIISARPNRCLSRAGLSKIEAGLRRVNDAELWMLAKVLACTLSDLFPVRPKGLARVLRQGRG